MKQYILALFLALLLTGCSALAPREYLSVTPHVEAGSQTGSDNAETAENYLSLKNAILGFVKEGRAEGVIHITNYDGDVESDLATAAYEVSKQDPLGAYAVDYMTHECSRIVSYYEIRIHITFRRTAAEIAAVESVVSVAVMQARIKEALNNFEPGVTLRISTYRDMDIQAMVERYCETNPEAVVETPVVTTAVYPSSGTVRILELNFDYTQTAKELQQKRLAVEKSVNAAEEYIRYRETERDKAELLFTYLMSRFHYEAGETATPLYSALCAGVADSKGLSQAWQLICDRVGIPCCTVSGMRSSQPYYWNIFSVDGYYRHLDLTECVMNDKELVLRTDGEMLGYYWDAKMYPVCAPQPEPPAVPFEAENQVPDEVLPEEETAPEEEMPPEPEGSPEEPEVP